MGLGCCCWWAGGPKPRALGRARLGDAPRARRGARGAPQQAQRRAA
jgi:hypothetical protein